MVVAIIIGGPQVIICRQPSLLPFPALIGGLHFRPVEEYSVFDYMFGAMLGGPQAADGANGNQHVHIAGLGGDIAGFKPVGNGFGAEFGGSNPDLAQTLTWTSPEVWGQRNDVIPNHFFGISSQTYWSFLCRC